MEGSEEDTGEQMAEEQEEDGGGPAVQEMYKAALPYLRTIKQEAEDEEEEEERDDDDDTQVMSEEDGTEGDVPKDYWFTLLQDVMTKDKASSENDGDEEFVLDNEEESSGSDSEYSNAASRKKVEKPIVNQKQAPQPQPKVKAKRVSPEKRRMRNKEEVVRVKFQNISASVFPNAGTPTPRPRPLLEPPPIDNEVEDVYDSDSSVDVKPKKIKIPNVNVNQPIKVSEKGEMFRQRHDRQKDDQEEVGRVKNVFQNIFASVVTPTPSSPLRRTERKLKKRGRKPKIPESPKQKTKAESKDLDISPAEAAGGTSSKDGFICPLCGFFFFSKNRLKAHYQSYTGTCKCSTCLAVFNEDPKCVLHIDRCHGGTGVVIPGQFLISSEDIPSLPKRRGGHWIRCATCLSFLPSEYKFMEHLWSAHPILFESFVSNYARHADIKMIESLGTLVKIQDCSVDVLKCRKSHLKKTEEMMELSPSRRASLRINNPVISPVSKSKKKIKPKKKTKKIKKKLTPSAASNKLQKQDATTSNKLILNGSGASDRPIADATMVKIELEPEQPVPYPDCILPDPMDEASNNEPSEEANGEPSAYQYVYQNMLGDHFLATNHDIPEEIGVDDSPQEQDPLAIDLNLVKEETPQMLDDADADAYSAYAISPDPDEVDDTVSPNNLLFPPPPEVSHDVDAFLATILAPRGTIAPPRPKLTINKPTTRRSGPGSTSRPICPECNKEFSNEMNLNRHIRTNHISASTLLSSMASSMSKILGGRS